MDETAPVTKRILDEATRKMLQGYTPFNTSSTTLFTPKEFSVIADESLRPIFVLRSMNQSEMTQLKKNLLGYTKEISREEITKIADSNIEILKNCVVGWSNLFDAGSGEEILFSSDILKQMPAWLVNSIMTEVKTLSGLTAADDLSLK